MIDITKYAHILQALGEGKTVQVMEGKTPAWYDKAALAVLDYIRGGTPVEQFRIAPSTVTLTYDIPKPMMERPRDGSDYWAPNAEGRTLRGTWNDDGLDESRFLNGIYATEADAQAAADAHKAAMAALRLK